MRVATTQFQLRAEQSVEAFADHLEALVAKAARGGADVVVFPELVDTGLLGAIRGHEVTVASLHDDYWNELTEFTPRIVEHFASLASRYGIDVLGGSLMRIDGAGDLKNTAYHAKKDGGLVLQDKIHLTPQEHELGVRGGDSVTVTTIGEHGAGILICADIQFPELSRYIARKGADLILCPSLTWNRRGVHRVRTGCQARAMENQLFVVMSPLVGHSGLPVDAPMHAVGEAIVAGPVDRTFGVNDGLLARAEETVGHESVLFCDLDFDRLEQSRRTPEAPGVALQRPDVYALLEEELR